MFVPLLLSEENGKCWKQFTSLSSVIIEDVWTYRTGRSKTALGVFLGWLVPCVVTFRVSKNRRNPGQA